MIAMILYVAAFVCFLLATFSVPTGRVSLVAAGLSCWILAEKILPALGA